MSCKSATLSSSAPTLTSFERHKSIIAYLSANNLSSVAATLRAESGLGEDEFDTETTAKYQTLLEKKWTGAARLQKKVWHLIIGFGR
jgi:platelet-activating factor acetylhydrolase IB subunit alpha